MDHASPKHPPVPGRVDPFEYSGQALRGIKTAELRSRSTTIVGERLYIYACKAKAKRPTRSDDLRVGTPPAWMIELAEQVKLIEPELLSGARLPTGVIVRSAVLRGMQSTAVDRPYAFQLAFL